MFFLSWCKEDTVLLARTYVGRTANSVGEFNKAVKKHRLAKHAEKTTMVFSRKHVECNVEIAGQRLTNVREQVHLGWLK